MSVQVVKELITKWTYQVDDSQLLLAIKNARHLRRAFKGLKKEYASLNTVATKATDNIASGWKAANTQLKLYKAQLAQVNAMHASTQAYAGMGYGGGPVPPPPARSPYRRRRGKGGGGGGMVGPLATGWAAGSLSKRPTWHRWSRTQRIGAGNYPSIQHYRLPTIRVRPTIPRRIAAGIRDSNLPAMRSGLSRYSNTIRDIPRTPLMLPGAVAARSRFAGFAGGLGRAGAFAGAAARTGMAGLAGAGMGALRKGAAGAGAAGGFLASQYLSPKVRRLHAPNILRSAAMSMGLGLVPAAAGVNLASKREGIELSLKGLTRNEDLKGTGEKTNVSDYLDKLNSFAAQTPFQIDQLRSLAVRLIAGGFKSNEVIPALQKIGDSTGASADKMDRMITNLIQIKAYDQAYTRDIKQFGTAGIPLQAELMKMMGLKHGESKESKEKFKKLMQSGGVDFKMVMTALGNLTGKEGAFFQMMLRQMETVQGRWSNLVDVLKIELENLGKRFIPVTKTIIEKGKAMIPQAIEDFGNVSSGIVATMKALAEASPVVKLVTGSLLAIAGIAWFPVMSAIAAFTLLFNDIGAYSRGEKSLAGLLFKSMYGPSDTNQQKIDIIKKKKKTREMFDFFPDFMKLPFEKGMEDREAAEIKKLEFNKLNKPLDYTAPAETRKKIRVQERYRTKIQESELDAMIKPNTLDYSGKIKKNPLVEILEKANNKAKGKIKERLNPFIRKAPGVLNFRNPTIITPRLPNEIRGKASGMGGSSSVNSNNSSSRNISVTNSFYVNTEQELGMAYAQANTGYDTWELEAWNRGSRAIVS